MARYVTENRKTEMEALVGVVLLCIAVGVFAWRYLKVILRLCLFALIGFLILGAAELFGNSETQSRETISYNYTENA